MRHGRLLALAFVLFSTAAPLFAHHSISAEFDPKKELTVSGTLAGVEWSNPHIVTYLDVTNPTKGKTERWLFEGNGPAAYHRAGIYKEDWKVGEKVTVTYAASKDGTRHFGFLKMMKYASDGHTMVFRVGGE